MDKTMLVTRVEWGTASHPDRVEKAICAEIISDVQNMSTIPLIITEEVALNMYKELGEIIASEFGKGKIRQ